MGDIYIALKPVLVISQCLGLGPVTYKSDINRLGISNPGIAFSSLILIVYSCNSGWVLYCLFVTRQVEINKNCQMACAVGVAIITMLLTIIQRRKVVDVVNKLYNIDEELKKLGITIPYDKIRRISLTTVVSLILILIFLTLHAMFVWVVEIDQQLPAWIAILVPPFYYFLMESQFILAALLLKKHFTLLNAFLTTFTGVRKDFLNTGKDLVETYLDSRDETYFGPKLIDATFRAWDESRNFHIGKEIISSLPGKQTQLINIKIFRKAHSNLCDVKEILNSAYSLQLLACIAQAFVIITSDLYLIFTTMSDSGFTQVEWLTYPIVWTIAHMVELVFVVVTCTKTSKQANATAVIVHKLLARDCDPDLRNQLKLFSIQLLHRKVSFSACGFFTIDMTLLQAIIGAATTYLVILIQFHLGQTTKH